MKYETTGSKIHEETVNVIDYNLKGVKHSANSGCLQLLKSKNTRNF